MKGFFNSTISLVLLFVLFFNLSCAGLPNKSDNAVQQRSQLWTGDGGKGMSLTILPPEAIGIEENQNYLPSVVQGEFIDNFGGFSAISVRTRESLDDVYEELFSGYYDDNVDAMLDLGHLTPTTHIMGGRITKTTTGYALQMQITKTVEKTITASYSGTFTFAELDNFTGVRRASLELIQKMGVTLTARAREELTKAAEENRVNGQTALARGLTAQSEFEELSYYLQAATYDPSLIEAVSRYSILNANISSGNIGEDSRNEVEWGRQWLARLTETEENLDSFTRTKSMPYTLFYSTDIQKGQVDIRNGTVPISIETHLHGGGVWAVSIERALQAMYDGLRATGKANAWNLANWPQRGVTNLNPFSGHSNNFSVVFELVNDQNKVIGRQTLQAGGSWELNWSGRPVINVNADVRRTLNFQNVNVDEITDRMTIRAVTVNGIDAENAAINGTLQIRAIAKTEFDNNNRFLFVKGEIKGFANYDARTTNIIIPNYICGDPVISIGERAFSNNQLVSITIPNSVISIGNNAFSSNQLTGVIIPDSVTSIGDHAFSYNQLASVTLGNCVTSIGANAFYENYLTRVIIPNSVKNIGEAAFRKHSTNGKSIMFSSINIGADVEMAANSFLSSWSYYDTSGNRIEGSGNGFYDLYIRNSRKAGTYSLELSSFIYFSGRHENWIYDSPGSNTNLAEATKKFDNQTMFFGVVGILAIGGYLLWYMFFRVEEGF